MKLSRAIYNTLAISAVLIGVANAADHSYNTGITNALSSSIDMSATITPSSTVEISANNVALEIVPSVNGAFTSDYATINTYTNTGNTCTVTMTTSSTNLTSGNNIIATLSDTVSETNFTNDRWGYRVGSNGDYSAVTTNNPITTYAQDTGSTALSIDVYFAAKLTPATKPGTYTDTVTFISTCAPDPIPANINNLEYMQDFATLTSSEMIEVLDSMVLNQQYQLKDSRDEKEYYVAKLADGNVWMTQNLDHNIITTENFYTYTNTDIGHGSTPNANAKWTAEIATYQTENTTWNNTDTTPESYDPGELCWNNTIRVTTLNAGTIACGNDKHYHIGNYYNWTAAVALNNSEDIRQGDIDQSICPSGWRLPTVTGNKTFDKLKTDLDLTAGTSGNANLAPAYFISGGWWFGSSFNFGTTGYYWTSYVNSGLSINNNNGEFDTVGYHRGNGSFIRCVIR